MDRRSVVIAPPPKVASHVLRAGPPKPRGPWVDTATGVLGALLLLVASLMVVGLPERDIILPQYEVSTTQNSFNYTSVAHEFMEGSETGRRYEFPFEVPVDNVVAIKINIGFTDDIASSDPDRFFIELRDPEGQIVEKQEILSNEIGQADRNNTGNYLAKPVVGEYNFPVSSLPQDQIVTGLNETESETQVYSRLMAGLTRPTAGIWTVRITLDNAGDCPLPTDPQRGLACRVESSSGQDTGNTLAVELFRYTYFDLKVSPV